MKRDMNNWDALEKQLNHLQKPQLPENLKKELKNQVMQRIRHHDQREYLPFSLRRLAETLRRKSKEVAMPVWASVMVKERVLDYVELSDSWKDRRLFENSGGGLRTAIAGSLLFLFVVSAIFVMPFRTPTAYARTTFIDDVKGDVVVVRKMEMLKAQSKMALEEGDKVLTRDEAGATIHFFDDSISRLGKNTSMEVSRLYTEPLDPVTTRVELFLEEGRVWTRVVNLTRDSRFFVQTSAMRADVQKKAAFDVHANKEKTEIAVYDNVVEIVPSQDEREPSRTVIAGYKAEVSGVSVKQVKIEKIPKVMHDEEEKEWVALNLTSDEAYESELVENKESLVESREGNPMLTSIFAVTDVDVQEAQRKIDEAYATLVNAEAQFVRGARKEGVNGLKQFKAQVADILDLIAALEAREPLYGQMVRDMLWEKIGAQLKDFSSFRPGDRLYQAKEALQETELLLASSDIEKVEVQLDQAEGALLEMQKLLAEGKPSLAATLLKRFQNRTNSFSLKLTEENVQEFYDKFYSLIERQVAHLKILTSIEQSIVYRDQFAFRDEVRNVREDTLRKFIIALEQSPLKIPEDLLLEVKDLYDSYVDKASTENDLIDPAVEKLLDKEYGVSFIQPGDEGVMAQPGVIVLVPQDASADVRQNMECSTCP